MTNPSRRVTLISGASGGIGADLARVFARHGHDLALVARSRAKLDALATEIEATGRGRPLVFAHDLGEASSTEAVAADLAAAGASVETLVNNAGYGLNGGMRDLDRGQQVGMIDLNIRSLTDMTLRFLPEIVGARGKILNVASVAAFLPGPGMAIYYATKAYVLSFSVSLGQELKASGVGVTCLCPGYTATDFQSRAGMDPKLAASVPSMTAMAVAEEGYRGLMAGRRRVVPGLSNKAAVALLPFVPNGFLLPLVARMQMGRGKINPL
jgi:short-subunit dehydrogenase